MSGELWLAEGVTGYYEWLILHSRRPREPGLSATAAGTINTVTLGPGR